MVVPSVPGFGFSDRPDEARDDPEPGGRAVGAADGGPRLPRFAAHGNDIGAVITGWMAYDFPERLIAIHTMMPGFPSPVIGPDAKPPSDAERAHAEVQARWEREEGGYNLIQETRPQTLGYGLHDSPAGLAAWILEKWRAWTDPAGRRGAPLLARSPARQRHPLLGDGTANAANRSYYERAREPRRITSRITVPTGVALSTEAVQRVPRERAERSYADIRRWTEFPRGGHFFAAEEPRLLAEELRAFFRPFRPTAADRRGAVRSTRTACSPASSAVRSAAARSRLAASLSRWTMRRRDARAARSPRSAISNAMTSRRS